jgi:thimet oligopeptidase
MQHSFSHLVDYDCRYYTYVFSQMIVKDMAGRFLEIVRGEVTDGGLELRRKVLEPGSTRDAVELVRDYLGRDFDPGAYFRWLDRETDCMKSVVR